MRYHSLAITLLSTVALHYGAARAQSAEEIAAPFASVAGSIENAVKLARGLHAGNMVALHSHDGNGNPTLVAFGLPENGMSWGEVRSTLARIQSTLASQGIHEGTASDVQAALLGGQLKRNDGSDVAVDGALGTIVGVPAPAAPRIDGMPIYGARPALPDVPPSFWGRYRPSVRPSHQIEHTTGIVNAGYLR